MTTGWQLCSLDHYSSSIWASIPEHVLLAAELVYADMMIATAVERKESGAKRHMADGREIRTGTEHRRMSPVPVHPRKRCFNMAAGQMMMMMHVM